LRDKEININEQLLECQEKEEKIWQKEFCLFIVVLLVIIYKLWFRTTLIS